MDFPEIHGISDIQETEAVTGSRTISNFSPRSIHYANLQSIPNFLNDENDLSRYTSKKQQNSPPFHELRDYVEKTLSSWGLKLGYLTENSENKMIINCFMQLISQKYNQQQSKEQLRKSLASKAFQCNKYSSLLEQQKLNNAQKTKMIGRLENTVSQYKAKLKILQQSCKKQKQQDKKLISMLKSKNEQILHEIKKKEQQISRVKQQMKKNVGEKSTFKNINFQVYEVFSKQENDNAKDKLVVLAERYESQKKNLLKQNLLLRQKLYDIREEIVSFAEWVDINIFRESNCNYKNKLVINHNLLFKKQSLVTEFAQILENARTGINEILSMYQQGKKARKTIKNNEQQPFHSNTKLSGQNLSPNKMMVKQTSQATKKPRQTIPTMKKRPIVQEMKNNKQPFSNPHLRKQAKTSLEPQFQLKDEQSQLSMISHLSAQQIVSDNKNYEKWDILFNHLQ